MVNQIINQPKIDRKWEAITSLIVGILSAIPLIQLLSSGDVEGGLIYGLYSVPKWMFWIGGFLSIIGIILGIKGLNSTKRRFAFSGIIFSLIGFLGMIFILYLAWISYTRSAW